MDDDVATRVKEFFKAYPLRKYPKGQIIIYAKEAPDAVYYIESGKVKSYDISYRGDEIILNIFKPPAFFPMSIALNNTENPYFYETEEATELRCAPAQEVIAFLKANPTVALDLLSRVYRGVDGLLGRVTHLMAGSAHSRVLYELLLEARRFGETQTNDACVLSIGEKDLASRAGLSRETVNRELHKLKDNGIIQISRNGMTIPDIGQLSSKLSEALLDG